jgi:hypothetical protein
MTDNHNIAIYNEVQETWITIDPSRQCRRCAKLTLNQPIQENMRFCDSCCVFCAKQTIQVLQKVPYPLRLYFDGEAELAVVRPLASICETCIQQHKALLDEMLIVGQYNKH